MGYRVHLLNEFALTDLTADGKVDLSDISTVATMTGEATASAKVLVEKTGFAVEVTARFPIIDVNRDGKIDLSDVSRLSAFLSSQQIATQIVVIKE